MGVETGWGGRIGLAGHEPGGTMVSVTIALTVDGHHVEQNVISHFVLHAQLLLCLLLLQVMVVGQLWVDH